MATLRRLFVLSAVSPVLLAVVLYRIDEFDAAELSADYTSRPISPPNHNARVALATETVGKGLLQGPEDFAYDAAAGLLYTSCSDGWIRRVRLGEGSPPPVENWAFVGGRPLGIALAPDGSLLVANADEGLQIVETTGQVRSLTRAAKGVKFALTDGVDVASDGMVYFTDASYKYNLKAYIFDLLEGRPYGRLMSYNPVKNETRVLAHNLQFPNGITLSPDEKSLIFCETALRTCKRYYISGGKKGEIETFIKNLPGFPDNIRRDSEGHYWIALAERKTLFWDAMFKYPCLRKVLAVATKYSKVPLLGRDGGLLEVDLDGEPLSFHTDPSNRDITVGLKIGSYLYHGHLTKNYISRIDVSKYAKRS